MAKSRGSRIHLLDEIRGISIILMVIFHALYTMAFMFNFSFASELYYFFLPISIWFAALFVLISGISCRLSHSNLKRGGKLLAISIGLTAVTWFLDAKLGFSNTVIWFGILHLLSLSMLIYGLLSKWLDKIHPIISTVIFGLLFAITMHIDDGYLAFGQYVFKVPEVLRNCKYLFPIGIVSPDFYSADYYPLFPWLFLFLIGASIGRWFKGGKLPEFFYNEHIRPVAYCGRHTLIIYLAHQPLIYGITWALTQLIDKIKA